MKKGFTLIETIAVLVLLGVTGALAGMMLAPVIQRFTVEREAAAANQKAEIALARIVKDFTWAQPASVSIASDGQGISWTSRHPARVGEGPQTLTWNSASHELVLNGNPLIDRVDHFSLSFQPGDNRLEITWRNPPNPTPYRTRLHLRDDI